MRNTIVEIGLCVLIFVIGGVAGFGYAAIRLSAPRAVFYDAEGKAHRVRVLGRQEAQESTIKTNGIKLLDNERELGIIMEHRDLQEYKRVWVIGEAVEEQ